VFQYHGTSLFLQNAIQDYFVKVVGAHEIIFHPDFNLQNSAMMNECKNGLRGHSHYDLYPLNLDGQNDIPIRMTISSIERGERNLEMLIVPKEFQFQKEFL